MTVSEPPGSARQYPLDESDYSIADGSAARAVVVAEGPGLRHVVRQVGRRRWLLIGVAIAVFAAVAAWTFLATPRYQSRARLRIESKNAAPSLGDQVGSLPGAGLLGLNRDELETEIGVLQSDRIADAMIDSLALSVRVKTPAASRERVLTARVADPTLDVEGRLTLTREDRGRYRVESKGFEGQAAIPPTMIPGTAVQIGGLVLTLNPTLLTAGPTKIVIDLLPRYAVYELLQRRLVIARQEGGSRLVEITYQDPDRVLAAQVVNRIVTEYVKYTTGTERGEDTTAIAELRFQVDTTARRLAAAEASLRAFEERTRLIVPEEQASAQIKRISALSTHVDAISAERNALARMLTLIEQRSRGEVGTNAYRQLATFPSLITNGAIQDLLQSLVDLENKRSTLGVRRTESNEEYRQLTDRITAIERQLYQLGPQYLESLDSQLATTVHTVTALTDTLQGMPGAAMQYGRLLRDRTILETTYLALQKQLKQTELKDVLRPERIRIIDAPRVANRDDPVFPKKVVMLVLGAVLGAALAVTLGLLLEMWRPTAWKASGAM